MNKDYTRELDLADMIIEWVAHWRSLMIFFVIGIVIAVGYYVNVTNNAAVIEIPVEEVMSSEELEKVKNVIDLNNEYNEDYLLFEKEKEQLSVTERSAILNNLVQSQNIIETEKALFTTNQSKYYNQYYNGEQTDVFEQKVNLASVKLKSALIVCALLFVHFIINAMRYVFDKKIKRTDDICMLLNIPEYIRIIDWNRVDKARGIDKAINKMRYSKMARISQEDASRFNAISIAEKMGKRGYKSVLIVGDIFETEKQKLKDSIQNISSEYQVRIIDGIRENIAAADIAMGVDCAVLVGQIGKTNYRNLIKEYQAIVDREIDIIGINIFD